jgi:hypothetical protein
MSKALLTMLAPQIETTFDNKTLLITPYSLELAKDNP